MPFKYNQGNNSSMVFVLPKYEGGIAEVNRIPFTLLLLAVLYTSTPRVSVFA
jgi:hypothetical protein